MEETAGPRNPARALHEQFNRWNRGGVPNGKARSADRDTAGVLADHIAAMDYFAEVRRIVDRFGAENQLLARLPQHYNAIAVALIAFKTGFGINSPASSSNFDQRMLDALDVAAIAIDEIQSNLSKSKGPLQDFVRSIHEGLVEDESVSGELKAYVHALLTSLSERLSAAELGLDFDLEAAMERLWVALLALRNTGDSSVWARRAEQAKEFVKALAKHGPQYLMLGIATTQLGHQMLTSGG